MLPLTNKFIEPCVIEMESDIKVGLDSLSSKRIIFLFIALKDLLIV